MNAFQPLHIARTHSFSLPVPAARAFDFFTPRGEQAWVPGWEPVFLHPPDGTLERGGAFLTDPALDDARTLWVVTNVNRARLEVSYARVTPASRIGLVDVRVTPASGHACVVEVSYTFTAVSEAGNAYLANFTEEYFRGYVESWRELILAHLAESPS